jgi:2-dehydropantoate 2-reductase
MKIYLIGVGGVGGFYGGMLAKAGEDITFVSRGKSYDAIKENGLVLELSDKPSTTIPVSVIANISEIKDPDLVILAVKSYDLKRVSKEMANVVNPETIVITLQNGLENDFVVSEYSICQVMPGIVYVASTKTSPNTITQRGSQKKLCFGRRDGVVTPKMLEVEELFKKAGIDAWVTAKIVAELWKKFLFVVSFSSATVVGRCSIGEALSNHKSLEAYKRVLREAIMVGGKEGIVFEPDIFEKTLRGAMAFDPTSKSSLLVDLENHRPTEVDVLQGEIIRLADKHDLEVPATKAVLTNVL